MQGGGKSICQAAILLALAGTANAGNFVVDKTQNPLSAASEANHQSLLNTALKNATLRMDILFKLPANVSNLSTPAAIAARKAAVESEIAAIRARYGANLEFVYAQGTLTPTLQGRFTAAGVTQVRADLLIDWYSDPSFARTQLRETNQQLGTNQPLATAQVPIMGATNDMIAIVDSGSDLSHPELTGRAIGGFCSSTSVPDSLGSICAVSAGGPCASSNSAIQPFIAAQCGHGTHVAGIALGSASNGSPANGIAPTALLMPVQVASVTNQTTSGDPFEQTINMIDLVRGLDYVFENKNLSGKRLVAVNLSLGKSGPWLSLSECRDWSAPVAVAITTLVNANISVVAAAGNKQFNSPDGDLAFPACLANVLAVGAVNKTGGTVSYSTYGSPGAPAVPGKAANLLAPGGDDSFGSSLAPCTASSTGTAYICAAKKGSTAREQRQGTSMSSPAAAGAIALFRDRFQFATRTQIETLLTNAGPLITVPGSFSIRSLAPVDAFKTATVPQNLSVGAAGCGVANVSWQSPSLMQATSYGLRHAATAAGLATATVVTTTNLLQSLSGLSGLRYFDVRATDARGNGAWSTPQSATIAACLAQVSGITIAGTTCNGASIGGIDWPAVSNTVFYEVEQRTGANPIFVGVATTTGIVTTHFDPVIGQSPNGTAYDTLLKVRACSTTTNCGAWSTAAVYAIGGGPCEG